MTVTRPSTVVFPNTERYVRRPADFPSTSVIADGLCQVVTGVLVETTRLKINHMQHEFAEPEHGTQAIFRECVMRTAVNGIKSDFHEVLVVHWAIVVVVRYMATKHKFDRRCVVGDQRNHRGVPNHVLMDARVQMLLVYLQHERIRHV